MKTGIGYKLFEMNPDGKLFPLFIGKTKETELGKWIKAEYIPTKGFASRGGWHIGSIPSAPWLMSADGTYKSKRSKYWKRVWCEIEYNANHNYDNEVNTLPKKCFIDKCPEDGFYFFKETGNRVWVITSDIKVNKIITEEERKQILFTQGFNEVKEFEPYRIALEKRLKKGA